MQQLTPLPPAGPAESGVLILFAIVYVVMSIGYLLPVIASAVFLWLAYKGRFSAPRTCAKCGAEMETPDKA